MITAIIPVRKGSQRVKNKNKKQFANSSLLEIKINQLLELQKRNKVAEVIVSSDDDEMLDIAKKLGAKTHKRNSYYASNEASNSEFFFNLANEVGSAPWIMYCPVTSPLVSIETYNEILSQFKQTPENIVTVSEVKHHLWKDGAPLNYNIKESPNSQDLPDIYSINYGISIIRRSDMIVYQNIVTNNPTFKILDEIESIDIDTDFDFMIAEIIYKRLHKNDTSNS
tara:strand:+ start:5480 stop:6154 length:675 start_codon:yes stop_codon:yes gene_type:complete